MVAYICCKICYDVCLERPKINEKEAGVGPFLKTQRIWFINDQLDSIIKRKLKCFNVYKSDY